MQDQQPLLPSCICLQGSSQFKMSVLITTAAIVFHVQTLHLGYNGFHSRTPQIYFGQQQSFKGNVWQLKICKKVSLHRVSQLTLAKLLNETKLLRKHCAVRCDIKTNGVQLSNANDRAPYVLQLHLGCALVTFKRIFSFHQAAWQMLAGTRSMKGCFSPSQTDPSSLVWKCTMPN